MNEEEMHSTIANKQEELDATSSITVELWLYDVSGGVG